MLEGKSNNGKEINQTAVLKTVHQFLVESEKYNVKCLDLESEIIQTVISWIAKNRLQLVEDFKNFYPKTMPLMRDLEKMLSDKLDINRINTEASGKEFRSNKIVGEWASQIYDSVLDPVFRMK